METEQNAERVRCRYCRRGWHSLCPQGNRWFHKVCPCTAWLAEPSENCGDFWCEICPALPVLNDGEE